MAPRLTTLSYALLGLVKMQPNTGYGLRKVFQETPMARYGSSPGAIYPALRNLESAKLISGKLATGKTGREKQTFRCTAAGTRRLIEWLRAPVTVQQVQEELDVVLLRFSYLDLVNDLDWSIEFVQQFLRAIESCRAEVQQTKASMQSHAPMHGLLALSNGIDVLSAHADWATSTLRVLKQRQVLP